MTWMIPAWISIHRSSSKIRFSASWHGRADWSPPATGWRPPPPCWSGGCPGPWRPAHSHLDQTPAETSRDPQHGTNHPQNIDQVYKTTKLRFIVAFTLLTKYCFSEFLWLLMRIPCLLNPCSDKALFSSQGIKLGASWDFPLCLLCRLFSTFPRSYLNKIIFFKNYILEK